jgi:hypothetical protein
LRRLELRDHGLVHARGVRLHVDARRTQRLDELLRGDAEIFGRFVDPYFAQASNSSLNRSSWPASTAVRSALPIRFLRTASCRHPTFEHTYAPRPGARPPRSSAICPRASRAIRTSSDLGAFRRQPTHVRRGTPPTTAASPLWSPRPGPPPRLPRLPRRPALRPLGLPPRSSCVRAARVWSGRRTTAVPRRPLAGSRS